mgnify:FL=1
MKAGADQENHGHFQLAVLPPQRFQIRFITFFVVIFHQV